MDDEPIQPSEVDTYLDPLSQMEETKEFSTPVRRAPMNDSNVNENMPTSERMPKRTLSLQAPERNNLLSHSDNASVMSFVAAPILVTSVEPKAAGSSGDPLHSSTEVVEENPEQKLQEMIGMMTAEEVASLKHNRVFEFFKMHRLERFILVTFLF